MQPYSNLKVITSLVFINFINNWLFGADPIKWSDSTNENHWRNLELKSKNYMKLTLIKFLDRKWFINPCAVEVKEFHTSLFAYIRSIPDRSYLVGFWLFSSLLRSSTVKRIFDNCDTYLGFVDTGTFRNRHGIHLRTPKSEDLDYFESLLAAKIEAYGSSKDYLEYVSIRELAESIQNSKGRITETSHISFCFMNVVGNPR